MRRRDSSLMASSVRMLCNRSASLIRMTRRSRAIASIILRKALGIRLLATAELDLVELGDAVHQLGHVLAELRGQLGMRHQGVFERVMQDRRAEPVGIEAHFSQMPATARDA